MNKPLQSQRAIVFVDMLTVLLDLENNNLRPQALDILKEMRQTCDVKLISTSSRQTTLNVNTTYGLGFETKDIVAKEDYLDFEGCFALHRDLSPECLLLSQAPRNFESSRLQRSALGIDPEQQVKLESLHFDVLNNKAVSAENKKEALKAIDFMIEL